MKKTQHSKFMKSTPDPGLSLVNQKVLVCGWLLKVIQKRRKSFQPHQNLGKRMCGAYNIPFGRERKTQKVHTLFCWKKKILGIKSAWHPKDFECLTFIHLNKCQVQGPRMSNIYIGGCQGVVQLVKGEVQGRYGYPQVGLEYPSIFN